MEYCLRQIEHGNPYPLIIDLNDDCMMIGSDGNQTLSKYPQVSPCHAHFIRKRGGWLVRDLDSKHGTYVNSIRIGARPQKLQIGDQIGLGGKSFAEGFICALDLKKIVKKPPEVIDLIHDSPVKDSGASQWVEWGIVNGHWNPLASSGNCSDGYYTHHIGGKKVQLRYCYVPLVRCDSVKFLPYAGKSNVDNQTFETKAVADNVPHKQFKVLKHTKTNLVGENSSINCRKKLYPSCKIPECFIPLVRCDSLLYRVPYDPLPLFDSEGELIPIMVENKCVNKNNRKTSKPLSKKVKPKKNARKVEQTVENSKSSAFGSEEKIIPIMAQSKSVDKSNTKTSKILQRKVVSEKQIKQIDRVIENVVSAVSGFEDKLDPSKVKSQCVEESNTETSGFMSKKEKPPKQLEKVIENGVNNIFGPVNRRKIVSSDSSESDSPVKLKSGVPEVFSNQHQEIEQNSETSEKLSKNSENESHKESKDASPGNYLTLLNKTKSKSSVKKMHKRQFVKTKKLPPTSYHLERFSNDIADNRDSYLTLLNSTESEDKRPIKKVRKMLPFEELPLHISSSDGYNHVPVNNHVEVSEKNQYSVNENVEIQKDVTNQSVSVHDSHSDSSVASMDYEMTPSIGNDSNYITLLNSTENSTTEKNGLDSFESKKSVKIDSLESKKSIKFDSSENTKKFNKHSVTSRYLTLLNGTESEEKSSLKKVRKTLPVEALPLHSRKFRTEEKMSLKKKVLQIHSLNSRISKKKNSLENSTRTSPVSSFKIPKVLKSLQQKKRDQKTPHISKQNDISKVANKKSPSISRHSKISTSRPERLLSEMRTKDFKRRPMSIDRPLNNEIAVGVTSNDTSNSSKCASTPSAFTNVPESTSSEMVELRNSIVEDDLDGYVFSIPVIVSERIPETGPKQSIVDSNLTVLSPPCNTFLTDEELILVDNTLDCSDSSSLESDQILSNTKDAIENLITSTKEATQVPSNPPTSSIAHMLSELVRRTKTAAQTSSVDIAIPSASVSEISEIVEVNSIPTTPKQLSVADVHKVPRSICSDTTNDVAGSSQVHQVNLFSDISTSKLKDIVTFAMDPRKKLTVPNSELYLNQLPFAHQASCSGDSSDNQIFSSSEYNSPLCTPKVNQHPSSLITEIQNLVFGTNSPAIFTNPTLNQLSFVNNQLTSSTFNIPSTVSNIQPTDIPNGESKHSTDLATLCPEQLPDAHQRLASTESNGKPKSVVISYMHMIRNVVNLNLKWLKEQALNNKPPPEVSKGAAVLPLYFSSFDQYVSAFVPMLRLEIWKKMFDEYKIICEDELLSNKFSFIILSHKNHKNEPEMSEYNCEALVDKQNFEPCEGNVIIMHINDIKGTSYPMLCYIHAHKTKKVNIANLNPEWSKVQNIQSENLMLCKFSVYAKLRPMMPLVNKIMKGNGICSIKNKLVLADALQKLNKSPLGLGVICPQTNVFSVNRDTSGDFSQEAAVDSLSWELRKPIETPKILLLRGPPGTGKSYIIVSLLQKLIYKEKAKVKILLTAPTDVAVDEIAFRLIKKKLKFIRFGTLRYINERIRPFTLAGRAEKMKEESIRKTEQRKERLEKLQTEIAVVKITDTKCDKKLRTLLKEKIALERRIFKDTNVDPTQKNYQNEVLKDADVILTTLSGCVDPQMSIFKPGSPLAFTCCIVDHASQCTEIDILPALGFGMSKLLLVGDPYQLNPMVNSKWTAQYKYEQSMFDRFHDYFLNLSVSPSLTLQKQFRMHSEICFFPSNKFYSGGLKTPPEVDVRYITFPFHPYIVYDISEKQEKSSAEHCTNFILAICNQLLMLKKLTFSIGIIVPTREDRSPFLKVLSKQKALKSIEVNTVEGFQGREKDMIIMSCASSSGISRQSFLTCSRRFNVALTRARKCLIVCIGTITVKQTKFWMDLIEDAINRQLYSPAISIKDITLTFLPTMLKKTP